MSDSIKFPIWFTVLTVAVFLMNLFPFGIFSILHPQLTFPDLGGTAADFPIQFFAVRSIAFAFPLLYGLLKKNVTVLITCYSMFLIVAALDVALIGIKGYYVPLLVNVLGDLPQLAVFAISFCCFIVPMSLALKHLLGYKNN